RRGSRSAPPSSSKRAGDGASLLVWVSTTMRSTRRSESTRNKSRSCASRASSSRGHLSPDLLHLPAGFFAASTVVDDVLGALLLDGHLGGEHRPRPVLAQTASLDQSLQLDRLGDIHEHDRRVKILESVL